jgi:hypothetical protein
VSTEVVFVLLVAAVVGSAMVGLLIGTWRK